MGDVYVTHGFSAGMLAPGGHVAVVTPATAAEVRGAVAAGAQFRVSDRGIGRALARSLGVAVPRGSASARVQPGDTVYSARPHGRGGVAFTRVRLLDRDELGELTDAACLARERGMPLAVGAELDRLAEVWRG